MDGVLAKWNSLASQEDTFEKGYFLNRKPDNKAIEYVQNLVNKGNDVCILSHAYQNGYASIEKREWLDNHGLENIPSIFVPYGVPKLDNIGIKYYNGINGNHGTWKGNSINPELNPLKANDSMQNDEQNIDFEILM